MQAIQFTEYGGPEVLHVAEVPMPAPKAGEVRIRVRAAAVNPADPKWRQGMFQSFAPVGFPHILGYDVAGIVDALGPEVTKVKPGDRVFAMLNPFSKGGYAEYVVTPAADAVPIPQALDYAVAAALPTAGLTGVQMIEEHAKVSAGQTILITGATGSVGRFAMFAARHAGAHIVAAVRKTHADEARALGAEAVIWLGEEAWSGGPFDNIIDTVGGPAVAKLCLHLAAGGGIFTAATTPIDKAGLSAEPVFVIVHNDQANLNRLAGAVASGELAVPIAQLLPLSAAIEAHRLVEKGGAGGKIILEPGAA